MEKIQKIDKTPVKPVTRKNIKYQSQKWGKQQRHFPKTVIILLIDLYFLTY